MSNLDLHYRTLLEAAEAIRTRKVPPGELTHSMLDRIVRLDSQLHAYATVTTELALQQAKTSRISESHPAK
jgi:amidase